MRGACAGGGWVFAPHRAQGFSAQHNAWVAGEGFGIRGEGFSGAGLDIGRVDQVFRRHRHMVCIGHIMIPVCIAQALGVDECLEEEAFIGVHGRCRLQIFIEAHDQVLRYPARAGRRRRANLVAGL